MCGIVGIGCFNSSGLWFQQVQMFKQLLVIDSLRGIDGSGIVRVKKDGNADWRKGGGSGFDLLRYDGVDKWLSNAAGDWDKILIGHNRWASVGKKSDDNAHPFEHGHIVLVHNGYVSNLSEFGKKTTKFEVDSDGLAFSIFKRGILPVLTKLKGAYSIVYFDEKEKTLNFARNADRPMFFAFEEKKQNLIFGSEKPMLEWIIDRTKSKMDYPEIGELPIHTLMSFSFDGEMSLTPYEPPPAYVYHAPSQSAEEGEYEWAADPVTGLWQRTSKPTNLPAVIVVPPPPAYTVKPPIKAINDAWKERGGKAYQFPEQLFGYRVRERIQFIGMEKTKASQTQDQWRIVGSHDQYEKLELRMWVKGEAYADSLINDAILIDAQIRSMQREADGTPVFFVDDPKPLFPDDKPKVAALLTVVH